MKNFTLFFSMLLLVGLVACDESEQRPEATFDLGESFELPYESALDCSCGDLSVAFLRVLEDSRCPTGAQCFWEGRIIVELSVSQNGAAEAISLTHQASQSSFGRDTIGNYAISLLEVTPYPVVNQTIDSSEYRARLLVEEL